MPRTRLSIFVALAGMLVFALSGCVTAHTELYGACYGKTLPVLLDSTDLKSLFQDIAGDLCVDSCSDCAVQTNGASPEVNSCTNRNDIDRQTVLVTDFADIQTFIPNQSGLLMGELMRGGLNKSCCYKIVQAEFGKYFKLSEHGLVVLTRKVSEIKKDEYAQPEAVVGTYNYLNNSKVLVFVRRINTETGKISKMVTREIDYSCAGRLLRYTIK